MSDGERKLKKNSHKEYCRLQLRKIGVQLFLVLFDYIAVLAAYYVALYLRFDFKIENIPTKYLDACGIYIPRYAFFVVVIYALFRLYHSIWKYASVDEFVQIIWATFVTVAFHGLTITVMLQRMPISYYLVGGIMQFALTLGVRFSYRFLILVHRSNRKNRIAGKRVMIIGGGAAGNMVIKELERSKEIAAKVCCIVDDDQHKWGMYISGIPVVGGREMIQKSAAEYEIDQILFCIPRASGQERKEILSICKDTGCELKTLPGVYQFVNGEISISQFRNVEIEDLLGREPILIDTSSILQYVKDKTVLVTGGGGSIGSEICRQVAAHNPKRLVILDIYENTTYDIQQELKRLYPELVLTVLIGSVRNTHRVNSIFETYKPDIVFHAAAHKHVPLMEDSPNEAIKNNVFGTLNCAKAAQANGAKKFVLISTDKAVNPTNIMGATKRLCEMIIQGMSRTTEGTDFAAVRFGNVLGSNGSVIPLFKKQIEEGGPVTVTDKNIIRYFMTIPEAVSLVLQAGAYAKGGEIFILDMGEPVRIDDLARNLIRLSGYQPDVDMRIEYTGLRPGEKLYEELLMSEEGMQETANKLIHIGKPIDMNDDQFFTELKKLKEIAYEDKEPEATRSLVQKFVPTYHCPEKAV